MTDLECDQPDCPIATEGACLEGFPTGEGCPHLKATAVTNDDDVDTTIQTDDAQDPDTEPPKSDPTEEWIGIGGDDPLTITEANEIAAEQGGRLILVAGEFEAGKTTLFVELYGRFLNGPFGGWRFAGSRNLFALDRLHFPTRYASGRNLPTTPRTQEEQEGLIHLRLASGERHLTLFISDLRGERFENITDGAPVRGEIALQDRSLATRADRTVVLVDGAHVQDHTRRQEAIQRGRLLIGSLTDSGGIRPGSSIAIVLTKLDLLDDNQLSWWDEQAESLLDFATDRGAIPNKMAIAARPANAQDQPQGLEELLAWMTEPVTRREPVLKPPWGEDDRMYWRFPGSEP